MKRDYRLDVIRTVAIFMIFTFHFCGIVGHTGIFYGYANGGWGSVGTTMFFILSGFLMSGKYHGKFSAAEFYRKRWLSVFPLFYLTFAVAFLVHGFTGGIWNYGGEWWRLIFTLLGCDNYLQFYGISSYALVGEWFTAVIVVIYLAYPFLNFLKKKSMLWGSVLVYGIYFLNLCVDWFQIIDDANPITGVAMFWTGMLAAEYEEMITSRRCLIPEVLVAFLIMFVKLPGNALLWKNLNACMIFGILFILSGYLGKAPAVRKGCGLVSQYSYSAYLCHHFILIRGYVYFEPYFSGKPGIFGLYAVCLAITAVVSVVLYQVMEAIRSVINMKKCNAK